MSYPLLISKLACEVPGCLLPEKCGSETHLCVKHCTTQMFWPSIYIGSILWEAKHILKQWSFYKSLPLSCRAHYVNILHGVLCYIHSTYIS